MDTKHETPESTTSKDLTLLQELFVQEYLVDLNATKAALRAGYSKESAKSIGSENLTKPDIRRAIDEAMAERSTRTGITADRVLREIAMIAFSDIREIEITPEGKLLSCGPETPRAVAGFTFERTETKDGPRVRSTIRLHNKLQALVVLMQHLGLVMPDVPPLENLLARLPEKSAVILRKLIVNPDLMPTSPPKQEQSANSQPASKSPSE
ncbi:MAG: terminase small subunit [Gemmataceae bacterium]|nr:terminase small subunit [Gemmataceae bacterium]